MIENSKLVSINKDFEKAIDIAKQVFLNNGVFIYPTDTIYGFGANPFSDAAQKITKIKGRDEDKKFILLVPNISILRSLVELQSERYFELLKSIWPNPVSVVLNLNNQTQKRLDSKTAAFRIPNHQFCLKLLQEINSPLISTSVNRSGMLPLLNKDDIVNSFENEVDAIFYEENNSLSSASTLINMTGTEPALLREGKLNFSEIMMRFNTIFKV